MKNKEEIKREISALAKKIHETDSDIAMFEAARELYEKSILLKYSLNPESLPTIKQENITEAIKREPEPEKKQNSGSQVPIDLFSSDTIKVEHPTSAKEKPAPKEPIPTKKKSDQGIAEKLQRKKITDLKASIGINEKFQFINELFEGNMKEYNVAVDQVNNFSSYAEAESYIANLQEVYKWKEDNSIKLNFIELIQRRFL